MVGRLDTVVWVYSPVVPEVAKLGEPAIPLVVEKIMSKRRLTAGGAVYVLKHLESEKAIQPLIDAWDKSNASEALFGVAMILGDRPDLCRAPPVEGVDEDRKAIFQALLQWAVLERTLPGTEEGERFPDYHLYQGHHHKNVVVISTDGLNPKYTFDLPGEEVRGKGSFEALAVLWLDMKSKKSRDSSAIYLSGGGAQTFRRKTEGEWRVEAILGGWIS
jgi:hypothetical protein